MHLRAYRDEARSGHLELVGGGDRPWTIDLITMMTEAMLVIGFATAIAVHVVR